MKIVSFLFVSLIIFAPFLVNAQLVKCGTGSEPCKFSNLVGLVKNVFEFLITLAIPLAVGSITVAGIMYVSGGAFGSVEKAKEILKYAIGGLFLALGSYVIISTILTVLTGDTNLLK